MSDGELDRILAEGDEIVPSSGFLLSVMEAVRAEAEAPVPIAMPWRWAAPGLLGWGMGVGTVVWVGAVQFGGSAGVPPEIALALRALQEGPGRGGLGGAGPGVVRGGGMGRERSGLMRDFGSVGALFR